MFVSSMTHLFAAMTTGVYDRDVHGFDRFTVRRLAEGAGGSQARWEVHGSTVECWVSVMDLCIRWISPPPGLRNISWTPG